MAIPTPEMLSFLWTFSSCNDSSLTTKRREFALQIAVGGIRHGGDVEINTQEWGDKIPSLLLFEKHNR